RIKLRLLGRTIDLRVSSLPTIFGEKVVMRILDKGNLNIDLNKLGFQEQALNDFSRAIAQPYGMVLVTGPTRRGQPTTLYSVLSTLHTNDAPSTVNRIIDMGIEPFLVASSVNLICAQRLLRKVCPSCKTEIKLHPEVVRELGFSEEDVRKGGFFEGKGCVDCN